MSLMGEDRTVDRAGKRAGLEPRPAAGGQTSCDSLDSYKPPLPYTVSFLPFFIHKKLTFRYELPPL